MCVWPCVHACVCVRACTRVFIVPVVVNIVDRETIDMSTFVDKSMYASDYSEKVKPRSFLSLCSASHTA